MVKLMTILVEHAIKLVPNVMKLLQQIVLHVLVPYSTKVIHVLNHVKPVNGVMMTTINVKNVTLNVKHVMVLKMTNV